MSLTPDAQAKLRHLPDKPGVYLMKDAEGAVLYVGKAKALRNRVRSYFARAAAHSLKTRELVRRVVDFDTLVVDTEAEALILENNLIKEYRPRFNISLKDDKSYPYIKVTTQEPYPRIFVTRRLVRDGARYFGPYTDVRRMREALELVKRVYTVRSCRYALPTESPERPCLDHHIGRCLAPCVGYQSQAEYRGMIDEITEILNGKVRHAVERLATEMRAASDALEFERAAELRDTLNRLESLETRQKVVDLSGTDRDVVGFARDADDACVVVLRVREGRLLGREAVFLSGIEAEPDEVVLDAFAGRFYTAWGEEGTELVPPEIVMPAYFPDRSTLEELLRTRLSRTVRFVIPQRGERARLVGLAGQNAQHLLDERKLIANQARERAPDALFDLQESLELAVVPRRILCFDVSHTQGTETVASAVVFENGAPKKSEYRRMRIRGDWGNDDFRSMAEAVERYFRRVLDERRPLPDLVVIDGGRGQLSFAMAAMSELALDGLTVVGLAKREEEIIRPDRSEPLRLPKRSEALKLLQRLRDEAHRFAITYNRTLRTRRTVQSALASIPGVGPRRQTELLRRFGSVRALAGAPAEEIAQVAGIGARLAEQIVDYLKVHAAADAGRTPERSSG